MSKILVIGGTGYAGTFITTEANRRNHDVVVLSRSKPSDPVEGVEYTQGSADDTGLVVDLLGKSDVVVATASPRGDMAGKLAGIYADVAKQAAEKNVRLVVIGGFSTLRSAPGAPRFFEDGSIPAEYRDEALELASVFEALKGSAPAELDWVFISPAAIFGSYVEVADTGKYQLAGDVALFDENGESKISGADFAIGVVDEIENNQHHGENISITQ